MFRRISSRKKKMNEVLTPEENEGDEDGSVSPTISVRSESKKNVTLDEAKKPSEVLKELFQLPVKPQFSVRTELHDTISIIKEYSPTLVKYVEWSLMFMMGYLGFSYAWIICFLLTYHTYIVSKGSSNARTRLSAQCSVTSEKDVFQSSSGVGFESFPSWVSFPDFDRSEWINVVMKKIWPHIGQVSNTIAKKIIEPKINEVLQKMNIKNISNFKLKEFILGSTPVRVGGIKAYDRNTDREEIVIDVDVVYAGDARVLFSVQGMDCEINQVNFRAVVRLVFKPLIDALPIAGGLECYFISMPSLDYNLGGMANVAEIPGISNILHGIIDKIIKKGFVWPNRLRFFLPLDSLKTMEDKSWMMPHPTGVLSVDILRGRNLVKMDLRGTSDPYVIAYIGRSKFNFVDKYVKTDCNPEWNYNCNFPLEEPSGHKLVLKVYDYDVNSEDDFMGEASIDVEGLIDAVENEQWISLQEVKHGDVLIRTKWNPIISKPVEMSSDRCILTLFIHSCENVSSDKKSPPFTRCNVKMGNEKRGALTSKIKGPSYSPSFKQGFVLMSNNPATDNITVSVEDHRSGAVLGQVTIQLSYIIKLADTRFNNMKWYLDTGLGNSVPDDCSITLSAALFSY